MEIKEKLSLIVRLTRLLKSNAKESEIFNEISKIAIETTNADRSTIYIYNQNEKKLTSKIARGVATKISIDLGAGLAGTSAQKKEVLIENDAYNSKLFNKEIDLQTGYTTTKILSAPIIGNSKKLLGVMQVLNKQDGDFDEEDSEILELISQIASSVIENYRTKKVLQEQISVRMKTLKTLNTNLEKVVKKQIEEIREKDNSLYEQSKKAALGDMIGIIAHQLKQPLNSIGLLSQLILDMYQEREKDYVYQSQKDIFENTQFMSATIDDFKNFFNPNRKKSSFSVKESVEKVINILSIELKKHHISISVNDSDVSVYSFNSELQQIFLNLISNSIDAIVNNSSEKREISVTIKGEERKCHIEYRDTGGGIPEEIISKVFNQYFSTKGRKGTGLGLFMVKMLIDALEGSIEVKNSDDGAVFDIVLPLSSGS